MKTSEKKRERKAAKAPQKAVITLTDSPDGRLGVSIAYTPSIKGHKKTTSPAVQASLDFLRMIVTQSKEERK